MHSEYDTEYENIPLNNNNMDMIQPCPQGPDPGNEKFGPFVTQTPWRDS